MSLTSGAPQSLIRYVLGVPALYIALGRLGKNVVFDRAWSLASILLLGMEAMLFSFDMWVARVRSGPLFLILTGRLTDLPVVVSGGRSGLQTPWRVCYNHALLRLEAAVTP